MQLSSGSTTHPSGTLSHSRPWSSKNQQTHTSDLPCTPRWAHKNKPTYLYRAPTAQSRQTTAT
ncbi:hypothetical protein BC567DRAFT_221623 [Phyllosticta citribraziliensis]